MANNKSVTPAPKYTLAGSSCEVMMVDQKPCVAELEQTKMWRDLDEKNYQMYLKKNSDYSAANILYMGVPGVLIRIWDKVCRLYSLFGVTLPNFAQIFDKRKAALKQKIAVVCDLGPHSSHTIELDAYIDQIFREMETECKVDFTQFAERVPKNESIVDAFNDLELYARIGQMSYLNKWGR